ncbi:MAG: UvrD-helicase domain-containing protein, partial [Gammaproteobacteria bacterium]
MTSDDAAARRRALDPARSFAVRAPAGSGKTTLLTQRFLGLLAVVEHPEQIVAITFTRKAAEEMRRRILDALALADGPAPEDDFSRGTWTLARAAAGVDRERSWQLRRHPGRLRIMTIDALCQMLVRQMPVTAGMAGPLAVVEDARQIYREAARDALSAIAGRAADRRRVASLLAHLDNDWGKLEGLLADMLGRREQWLPALAGGADGSLLERARAALVDAELARAGAALSGALMDELVTLLDYADQQRGQAPRVAGLPAAGAEA